MRLQRLTNLLPFEVPANLAGTLLTLVVKALGSLLAIAVFAVAARNLDTDTFGRLVVTFNLAALLGAVAVLGQDTLIIRSWAEARGSRDDAASHGAYLFGHRVAVIAGAVVASAFLWLVTMIGASRLSMATEPGAIAAAAAFLFSQTVLLYHTHASRAICGVAVSEPHGEVTWRLGTLGVFLVGLAIAPAIPTTVFFAGAAAGSLFAAALQAISMRRDLPPEVRSSRPRFLARDWSRRSARMAASTTAEATSQYVDVVLIALLASPTASAVYFVAARLANVFAMIAGGLHGYASSRFAALHYSGDPQGAQALLATISGIAAALVGALAIVVVTVGGPLLALFGEAYRQEFAVLLVLAAGTAFTALMGPTSIVLMATGHERLYGRAILIALAVRASILVIAVPAGGALAAAAAVSVVSIPTALWLARACRRHVGVDPSIFGLVFRSQATPVHPTGGGQAK